MSLYFRYDFWDFTRYYVQFNQFLDVPAVGILKILLINLKDNNN